MTVAETCELCGRALAGERRGDEPALCTECLEQVMVATFLEEM
jgi:hypothetical protein